jgi:hypothetical protein
MCATRSPPISRLRESNIERTTQNLICVVGASARL